MGCHEIAMIAKDEASNTLIMIDTTECMRQQKMYFKCFHHYRHGLHDEKMCRISLLDACYIHYEEPESISRWWLSDTEKQTLVNMLSAPFAGNTNWSVWQLMLLQTNLELFDYNFNDTLCFSEKCRSQLSSYAPMPFTLTMPDYRLLPSADADTRLRNL